MFAFARQSVSNRPPAFIASRLMQAATLFAVLASPVLAQDSAAPATELPAISIETTIAKPKAVAKKAAAPLSSPEPVAPQASQAAQASEASALPAPGTRSGSLTVPTAAEAKADIQLAPGAVELVPAEAYATSTPATTIKDVLDYVPACSSSPNGAKIPALSIRGSGLSRNFHLRGMQLYMDGIPINTADGYGDFQEIDPSAYRYIEVFKGGNALRFGANSLGGAINFVMPTGHDSDPVRRARRCRQLRVPSACGQLGWRSGPCDYFIAGSWLEQDGFRDHSCGESRARHRQRRLPAVGRRRDAVLPQRQLRRAAHSRQRDAQTSR